MSMTEKDVERWMVAAEKADRREHNPGQERPLRWPDLFVVKPEHRRAIRLWVWCEAHGHSFREVCAERGIPYTTANRHRAAALERITMLLSLERSMIATEHMVA